MTKLANDNFNTSKKHQKIAKEHYQSYCNSNMYNLSDLYGTYSQKKINAFYYCHALMNSLNGRNLKIIGGNSQTFSVGFEYDDEENGNICFAYITRDYNRYCEL